MNQLAIFDPQKRGRLAAKAKKTLQQTCSTSVETTPVFVLGLQRSGTTMLMFVFHLYQAIAVYDESRDSSSFLDFRLRSNTEKLLTTSPSPVTYFNSPADSHTATQLLECFPTARYIWALREYSDVANSFLRKFPQATRHPSHLRHLEESRFFTQMTHYIHARSIFRHSPPKINPHVPELVMSLRLLILVLYKGTIHGFC